MHGCKENESTMEQSTMQRTSGVRQFAGGYHRGVQYVLVLVVVVVVVAVHCCPHVLAHSLGCSMYKRLI
jgi:hypothetical protein